VLDVDAAAFRKRLSRARARLYAFMRARCGVLDPANACRCERQVDCAVERGVIRSDEPLLVTHPAIEAAAPPEIDRDTLERGASEVAGLLRMAEGMRGHPSYAAPGPIVAHVRDLLRSGRLKLLAS